MLRSCASAPARCAGVPGPPNSRSNTTRGLISIGSGVVGVLHEMVFVYAQLIAAGARADVSREIVGRQLERWKRRVLADLPATI